MASLTLPGRDAGGAVVIGATGTGGPAQVAPVAGSLAPGCPGDGLADHVDVEPAIRLARSWLERVEAALSPHRSDSDLCRWRDGSVPLESCSPLLSEVVDDVTALQRFTEGHFHPYDRRGRYDPTGYVKGWAVERAVGILTSAGIHRASLGVGGDVQLVGRAGGGRPWRVAVVDPTDRRRIVAVVTAGDADRFAVATSGEAERGAHLWPGHSSRTVVSPAVTPTVASVTVVGPDLRLADAFATSVWAAARRLPLAQAWAWLWGSGYEALAVDRSGRIATTPGMSAHLVRAAA